MTDLRAELLAAIADIPAHVEVRSALLRDEPIIRGERGAWVVSTPPGLNSSIFAVGKIDMVLLRQAAAADPEAEIVVAAASVAIWDTVPPGARRALIYELPGELTGVAPHPTVLLAQGDEAALAGVGDAELRAELEDAIEDGPIAVALAGEAMAAFCYAGSVTETLWDISIDTLEAHRRRGLAGAAVARMQAVHAPSGRRPVWGAEVTNAASKGLATKLGFQPVDEVWLWHAAQLLESV